MKKGIIFDLDGTLWDASKQVVPAWNIVLGRHKELNVSITSEIMQSFMGKQLPEIAKMLLPDMKVEDSLVILKECCAGEQEYLGKHGAILYEDLEKTLMELKEKYSLYIVSNCQKGYIETFLNYHKMWSYFDDIESSGNTGCSKGENIKLIIERNNLEKSVYVGDTMGDYEAAKYAEIPFIHASYGFGQVPEAKNVIKNFKDIKEVLKEL